MKWFQEGQMSSFASSTREERPGEPETKVCLDGFEKSQTRNVINNFISYDFYGSFETSCGILNGTLPNHRIPLFIKHKTAEQFYYMEQTLEITFCALPARFRRTDQMKDSILWKAPGKMSIIKDLRTPTLEGWNYGRLYERGSTDD
ncbi:hypothetical protein JTB14_035083 [Gonioctena quinquepunctata]|nr:hypothetical protein JTB14_035083 [Gonioctena quinquepunctata]